MPRLNFGAFLAPHHPVGEHPMLQFRRDLDLVGRLDKLGYDEFWCGEHHSSGWEMIASPELLLASEAPTRGVDQMGLLDRQDEAMRIIRCFFNGERVTAKSEWFTLQNAAVQ